jgi:hypothetical protein
MRHQVTKMYHNQEVDIYEITWYKIIDFSRLTYMLYKANCKQGSRFLPHGIKDLHKLWTPTKQA